MIFKDEFNMVISKSEILLTVLSLDIDNEARVGNSCYQCVEVQYIS